VIRELSKDGQRYAAGNIGDFALVVPSLVEGLDAKARADARDGFPAGGDGVRGSGTVRPSEGAAVANVSHPASVLADDLVSLLNTVRQHFERAEGDAAKLGVLAVVDDDGGVSWRFRDATGPKPKVPEDIWCVSHLRFDDLSPEPRTPNRGRRDLCSLCGGFAAERDDPVTVAIKKLTGSDLPPKQMLELAARQPKVMQSDLERIRVGLVADGKSRKVKRKRGRRR
jgi:hypothetical protein